MLTITSNVAVVAVEEAAAVLVLARFLVRFELRHPAEVAEVHDSLRRLVLGLRFVVIGLVVLVLVLGLGLLGAGSRISRIDRTSRR